MSTYIGMISSDWSQCLSPNGPFDALSFLYPELRADLDQIFTRYTGNEISLGQAVDRVNGLLPAWPTVRRMDDYLESCFDIYDGVRELIRWCRRHDILFMINSTGFMGYFQRAVELGLLPTVPVLSAHPMLRFDTGDQDPRHMIELNEVEHKARNSDAMAAKLSIPRKRIVIMGDSGGDGPHFAWGDKAGATLIGSMTKPSLGTYCRERGITIHHLFGHTYGPDEKISPEKERGYNFLNLTDVIGQAFEGAV